MHREFSAAGSDYLRGQFESGRRYWHTDYDEELMRARISEQIDQLTWQHPSEPLPMSPGLLLQEVIPQMGIRSVSALAVNGILEHIPDGPDHATYAVLGIESTSPHGLGRARYYLLDIGDRAVGLAVDIDMSAPAADSDPGEGAPSA